MRGFLNSPFTLTQLRREPEMKIYRHDLRLDGINLGGCPLTQIQDFRQLAERGICPFSGMFMNR